jgi:hypothetical protein
MLDFERRVTASLTTTTDPRVRDGVDAFVAGSLGDMPEHLRLGVLAQSVLLSLLVRGDIGHRLERSRIPLVPQYVRLFRSLVLFAEQELV